MSFERSCEVGEVYCSSPFLLTPSLLWSPPSLLLEFLRESSGGVQGQGPSSTTSQGSLANSLPPSHGFLVCKLEIIIQSSQACCGDEMLNLTPSTWFRAGPTHTHTQRARLLSPCLPSWARSSRSRVEGGRDSREIAGGRGQEDQATAAVPQALV